MVDKLALSNPTPGMLVLRTVDDAFIHPPLRRGGCPGYSLLAVLLQTPSLCLVQWFRL
jgi:hypothetical protein